MAEEGVTIFELSALGLAALRCADSIPARVGVSGHVYDVATGLVETIVPARRRVA